MDTDACHPQVLRFGRPCIKFLCFSNGNAELVLAQPRGNVWVRLRKNIRINADRDLRFAFQLGGTACQRFQFGFALNIEEQNAGLQSCFHLRNGFSDSRKDDCSRGFLTNPQQSLKLASRNYIKSAAQFCEQAKNAEIGVGFYRIADGVIDATKCVAENTHTLPNGGCGIGVKRSSESRCKLCEVNLLAPQQRFFRPAVNESGRPLKGLVHLRLAALPLTLIATTV